MNFNKLLQNIKANTNQFLRLFLLGSGLILINSTYASEKEGECPDLYVKYYPGNICHWEMAGQALAYESPREEDCYDTHERVTGHCVKNSTDLTMEKGMVLLRESEDKNCRNGEWLHSESSICLRDTVLISFNLNSNRLYTFLVDESYVAKGKPSSGEKLEPWSCRLKIWEISDAGWILNCEFD